MKIFWNWLDTLTNLENIRIIELANYLHSQVSKQKV